MFTKDSQTIIDLVLANNKIEVQIIYEPKNYGLCIAKSLIKCK